jgi:hypothetical protein
MASDLLPIPTGDMEGSIKSSYYKSPDFSYNGDKKNSYNQEICDKLPPGKSLPPMPSQTILIRPKTTFRRLEHWTV